MQIQGDYLVFSTGRRESANGGIVGIDSRLYAFGGYDSGLPAWPVERDDTAPLTKEERSELADHMIALWTQFKEADGPVSEENAGKHPT